MLYIVLSLVIKCYLFYFLTFKIKKSIVTTTIDTVATKHLLFGAIQIIKAKCRLNLGKTLRKLQGKKAKFLTWIGCMHVEKSLQIEVLKFLLNLNLIFCSRPDVQLIEEDSQRPGSAGVELEDVQISDPKLDQILKDENWVDDVT